MKKSLVVPTLGIALGALVLATPLTFATATTTAAAPTPVTVLDTFLPPNPGSPGANYYVTTSRQIVSNDPNQVLAFAESFTTPAGSPTKITNYDIPLGYESDTIDAMGRAVVKIVSDTTSPIDGSDIPNTSQVLDKVKLSDVYSDWNGAVYRLQSAKKPVLQPGTLYWLVLTSPTAAGMSWYCSASPVPSTTLRSQLITSSAGVRYWTSTAGGVQNQGANQVAVRISGTTA